MQYLAVAVPLVAVVAVFQGKELEERQGLVPRVALPVAWVFGFGSLQFNNTTNRPVHPVRSKHLLLCQNLIPPQF